MQSCGAQLESISAPPLMGQQFEPAVGPQVILVPEALRSSSAASQIWLLAPISGEILALPHLATTATYGASYRHRSLRCPRLAAS